MEEVLITHTFPILMISRSPPPPRRSSSCRTADLEGNGSLFTRACASLPGQGAHLVYKLPSVDYDRGCCFVGHLSRMLGCTMHRMRLISTRYLDPRFRHHSLEHLDRHSKVQVIHQLRRRSVNRQRCNRGELGRSSTECALKPASGVRPRAHHPWLCSVRRPRVHRLWSRDVAPRKAHSFPHG